MRSNLPSVAVATVRAVMVSAALLAGATIFPAFAQTERNAFSDNASPQELTGLQTGFVEYRSGSLPAFPQPLPPSTVARYKAIFRVLREGNAQKAAQLTAQLDASQAAEDSVVLPDLLAETYLHTDANPSPAELRAWLRTYPHASDVPAICALLEKRAPSLAARLPVVQAHILLPGAAPTEGAEEEKEEQTAGYSRNPQLERTVLERAAQGEHGASSALHLINATPGMTAPYAAHLYGEVALSLLSQGHLREALRTGANGAHRGEQKYGFPAFIAGLAAWKEGSHEAARHLFEQAANAPVAETSIRAGAAYWAARVAPNRYVRKVWLKRAALQEDNFYGMLASSWLAEGAGATQQQLPARMKDALLSAQAGSEGEPSMLPEGERQGRHLMGEIDIAAVLTLTEGRHFFALLQLGEQGRAEALVRRMWPDVQHDPMRARSLAVVARAAGMSAVATQIELCLEHLPAKPNASGTSSEANVVLPALPKPRHGFRLDPALVYAVARTESNFNAQAQSPAGARGLMQIRPQTASFVVAGHITYDVHGVPQTPVVPNIEKRLAEPGYNLEVGQLYLLYLAGATAVSGEQAKSVVEVQDTTQSSGQEGDLLHVLASYNAGPGAILRWETQQQPIEDPIYFMEILPNVETRHYVRQVLTTTWIYAHKLGLETPSLSALSRGQWPSVSEERHLGSVPS